MEHSESTRALVIDNGTGYIKAGFAGDEEPRVVFSTVIGRRSRSPSSGPVDPNEKEYYIGHKALRRNFLQTRYPIESGIIKNFDEMEKIWHHTFYNELRVAPEEYSVLLTESPWNINNIREKMTQTMFETFMTRGIHISISAVLSLNLSGNSTGVVVDSGDGATSIVPIHQGKIIAEPQKLQLTGVDLTDNLTKILTERGYWFTLDYRSREIARDMKENLCYVAQDYSYWDDINSYVMPENLARNYETLNGNVLAVDTERFRCPEALFQPSILGMESCGIPETIYNAIMKCNVDIRQELYGNIVISGGNSMFPGMASRIHNDLIPLARKDTKINVVTPTNSKNAAWRGGSFLASSPDFQQKWISKQDYDEYGPSIIHTKNS